ncbi:MAG: lysylphosphatidylglycerol synthase domain-containing protein [Cytophagaceae bacterium]
MKNTDRQNRLSAFVKIGIFVLAAVYIWFLLERKRENFAEGLFNALFTFHNFSNPFFLISLFLFPVNWGLESWKWKFLLNKIEAVTFIKAYRGVLTGVTFGILTPLNLGDYAGRILQLENPERVKVIGAIFLSRIAQFFSTLLFGLASVIYIFMNQGHSSMQTLRDFDSLVFFVTGISLAALIFLLFLFSIHQQILLTLKESKLFRPVYRYFEILRLYSFRDIVYVLMISLFRYLVFSLQFVLLLYFFRVSDNLLLLMMGVSFVFLVKSIIPTVMDLGVREAVAVYFFTFFNIADHYSILYSSLGLWFINIVIPAILGMFLVFRIRLFTR